MRELDGLKRCLLRGFWARKAIARLARMQEAGGAVLRGQRCAAALALRPLGMAYAAAFCKPGTSVSAAATPLHLAAACRRTRRREDEAHRGRLRAADDGILDCCLLFRARGAQVRPQPCQQQPGGHFVSWLPSRRRCACAQGCRRSSLAGGRASPPPAAWRPQLNPLSTRPQVELCTKDANLAVRARTEGLPCYAQEAALPRLA